ncbi:MAG: hypothetical protein J5680_07070 [Neisseriaceae bacterium]|nr:hypothetical protein [Neisseriaceae bacterium]
MVVRKSFRQPEILKATSHGVVGGVLTHSTAVVVRCVFHSKEIAYALPLSRLAMTVIFFGVAVFIFRLPERFKLLTVFQKICAKHNKLN